MRNTISAAIVLSVVVALFPACRSAEVPEGTVTVTVRKKMAAPDWALKERRLMELHEELARLFEKAYVMPDGHVRVPMEHGGGTIAPDDVLETLYKLPMHYALGAGDDTWRVFWKTWKGTVEQGTEQGLYVNEMPKFLDWHHNGENFEGFWLGALCAPNDEEYRRMALKYASLYDGSDRPHQNYDAEKKMIPSMLHGGAGPQLNPTVADWIEGDITESARKFWSHWLDCDHDGPVNLVTTNFGTVAFMLTGEEHWRKRTMGYVDAWRERARQNNGIIPSIVNRDGEVPEEWWGGVLGWDFKQFGGLFQVSSGPRAAWGNAALLSGDTSYYDVTRTLSDTLWENRYRLKKNIGWGREKGEWDVPRYYNGEKGWYNGLRRAAGVYTSILANMWFVTMKEEDLKRVLERDDLKGAAGHATWQEGGYEPEWVKYLIGKNPDWPTKSLDRIIRRTEGNVQKLKTLAEKKPDERKQRGWPRPWGWVGPMVNLMTGGPVPLWHGQLHMARFRYFDPERKRPGISEDCAALVEKLEDKIATVVLVNLSEDETHTVLVQTGAYGEHQCIWVQPEGCKKVEVDGTVFAVKLAPGAGQRLVVKAERFANTPTLGLPWDKRIR
ncbi:MAG: hypothetical protein ACLFWL_03680 [Candidatus Brocadiia bacterium]